MPKGNLFIKSVDREDPYIGNETDFVWPNKQPLDLANGATFTLENISIPLTWYNIVGYQANYNFNIDNTGYSRAIPEGRYTLAGLLQTLEDDMTAASGFSFSCTYDATVGKVTITEDGGTVFIMTAYEGQLFELLGSPLIQHSENASYTFEHCAILNPDDYLELFIEGLTQPILSGGTSRSTSFLILLPPSAGESTFGTRMAYQNDAAALCYSLQVQGSVRLDRPRIQLRHSDGSIVNTHGFEWSAVVSYKI